MKLLIQMLFLSVFLVCCKEQTDQKNHVFYLHGRIIELQGIPAISEKFGEYQYQEIISTLRETGATIHQEIRTEQTDFQTFCLHVSDQIDSLVNLGIPPESITVIGASKGAVMAMNISDQNQHPINYVLLGANNQQIEQENNWNLHGRILGIYEKTDALAGNNYKHWINKSTNAIEFKQIELNTGLGHGFIFQPIEEWITPTREWMKK